MGRRGNNYEWVRNRMEDRIIDRIDRGTHRTRTRIHVRPGRLATIAEIVLHKSPGILEHLEVMYYGSH